MTLNRKAFKRRLEEFDPSIYNIEKGSLLLKHIPTNKEILTLSFSMNLYTYINKGYLEN